MDAIRPTTDNSVLIRDTGSHTMPRKNDIAEGPSVDRDSESSVEELVERVEATKTRLQAIEIERVLYKKPYSDEGLGLEKALHAFGHLAALHPRDEFERMILVQMIGCHEAAVECFERASKPGQYPEAMDLFLKNAVRLSNNFANLMRSLDKHRGKGHQKVTVEHVHVESGGQAIVGNVETRQSASLRS